MIGIVILNYNTPIETCKCIESIVEKCRIPYKIALVDNNSTDDSKTIFEQKFKNVENINLIYSKKNGGYSYGNNLGIKSFESDIDAFLIVNSDVVWLNDIANYMYETLMSSDSIGVVGPSVLNASHEETQFIRKKLKFSNFILGKRPLIYLPIKNKRYINWQVDDKRNKCFFGMVSGCCFMVKANIFKSVGCFDENIFLYGEEDLIAYKLENINKKVTVNNNAKIIHEHSKSVNKKGKAFRRIYTLLSPIYILRHYQKIGLFKLFIASLITVTPYTIFAIFNKRYRDNYHNFISLYKKYANVRKA